MYIFPGFTRDYEDDGAIYLTSELYQSKVKISDPVLQAELHSMIQAGGCETLSSPLAEFLHEQGLIASRDEIDAAVKEVKKVLEESLLITIMPTEGCNFRCPYCYESHKPVSMRTETMNIILRYIKDQAPHFKNIQIGWFGGEPTLYKDMVLEATNFVQTLASVEKINFHSSMTTNGYLLDAEAFKQYYAAGITSFQVTLDGWNHDKTRPHVSGKGTLDKIIRNLREISELSHDEYRFHITLRHNILEGDTDYSWYDYLYKLFGSDTRFSIFIHTVGDWGGETVQTLNLLKESNSEELLREHIEYVEQLGMPCENSLRGPFSNVCYASYPHSMVFRADGKIEKCTVALNHPQNRLGDIESVGNITINDKINKLWSTDLLKSKCYTCQDLLSCLNMRCNRINVTRDGTSSNSSDAAVRIY